MKPIDKLRQYLEDQFGSERFGFHSYGYAQGMAIAKNIEEEISDNYMRLPVDADGVPIHVGDICEMNGKRFEVLQLITDSDCWRTVGRFGEFYMADLCHHVKPRTLEDVLREYACDFADSSGPDYDEEITRKYADEIRELLGGDAE